MGSIWNSRAIDETVIQRGTKEMIKIKMGKLGGEERVSAVVPRFQQSFFSHPDIRMQHLTGVCRDRLFSHTLT